MKICGTCQKSLKDQIQICPACGMETGLYHLPEAPSNDANYPRWTLFPQIPKTHWWGTELEPGPASQRVEAGSPVSSGLGVFTISPVLNLGVGLYEFHCLLSVNRVARRQAEIGMIRVLKDNIVIAQRSLKGEDFEDAYKESCIIIEFRLDIPHDNIRGEFSSNGIVSLGLTWMRLVPRFGWRWDGKNLGHNENMHIRDQGVILRPETNPDDSHPQLWGPYIYLSSGWYKLTAYISVESTGSPTIASWEVFRSGKRIQPLISVDIDSSQKDKLQTITRQFYLEEGYREVEFRIFVKQGKLTVHWLRLLPPEGPIWERYYELGGRDSLLGLPLSAEGRAVPPDMGTKGRYRRFEGGTVYFNSRTFQTWEVWGEIGNLYEKLGGTGGFGFPIGPVQPTQSLLGKKGEFQLFEGQELPGRAIFAYSSNRTQVCEIRGASSSKYWKIGGPNSSLGFPTKGEYDWSKESTTFKRCDFEGGYITWRSGEAVDVHFYPKLSISVEYPEYILFGQDLVITVIGELERGSVRTASCTVWFPDAFEFSSIKVEKASQDAQVVWPSSRTRDNYGNSDYDLKYPRVEMSLQNWPTETVNSFEVHLRPARSGPFRIFARMIAQDDADPTVWGSDPDPKSLGVVGDQQNETVHLIEVPVNTKMIPAHLDTRQDLESTKFSLQGKIETKDFDVFICHNGKDKPAVKKIGERLKEHGILPWLDEWELRPGLPWQRLLEEQIKRIKSAAVFVGKDGIGPWQQMELEAFLREFVNRGCPVIPVLLEDAPKKPPLPIFLAGMTWVDFRNQDLDPLERLIWGITGIYDSSR